MEMPKRELNSAKQITDWIHSLSERLDHSAEMILIGSGALLWHAAKRNITVPLPENSMDVDPITSDPVLLEWFYDALIGSDFELQHGWHVNVMPWESLDHLPSQWRERVHCDQIRSLKVIVPAPEDLLVPKLKRNEPRDQKHAQWAKENGLISCGNDS